MLLELLLANLLVRPAAFSRVLEQGVLRSEHLKDVKDPVGNPMMPFQHSAHQLPDQGKKCSVQDAEFVSWQLGNSNILTK